jgi:carboxypeptidase C (cathepsin A)
MTLLISAGPLLGAEEPPKTPPAEAAAPEPKPEQSVTRHTLRMEGTTLSYAATAGTFIVRNPKGEPWARMGYTAYVKEGAEAGTRPLVFAFNGGPGSSSLWLHLGALGPKRVVTANAEFTPPAPYRMVDNACSILDVADLVMIDPVGTGFSKAVGKAKDKDFWGVDPDIESVSRFIAQFTGASGRWNSPKYVLGESYGTVRAAGVANYLQSNLGMALNGVVLVSSCLDMETTFDYPGHEQSPPFYLPSYAAVAAYHHALPAQPGDLEAFLRDARAFALGPYLAGLLEGDRLGEAELEALAERMHQFTGLSKAYLKEARLRVDEERFRQELLRSRGITVGRIDARFTGPNLHPLAERAPWDPQGPAIMPAFTALWMDYLHTTLAFGDGKDYKVFVEAEDFDWDFKHKLDGGRNQQMTVNVAPDLAQALLQNPQLRVLSLNGLMDLATPFFATETTLRHLGLPPEFQDHVILKYYDAGHMMYLSEPDLKRMKHDLAEFIASTHHP